MLLCGMLLLCITVTHISSTCFSKLCCLICKMADTVSTSVSSRPKWPTERFSGVEQTVVCTSNPHAATARHDSLNNAGAGAQNVLPSVVSQLLPVLDSMANMSSICCT